jgi:hypothetical protein
MAIVSDQAACNFNGNRATGPFFFFDRGAPATFIDFGVFLQIIGKSPTADEEFRRTASGGWRSAPQKTSRLLQ